MGMQIKRTWAGRSYYSKPAWSRCARHMRQFSCLTHSGERCHLAGPFRSEDEQFLGESLGTKVYWEFLESSNCNAAWTSRSVTSLLNLDDIFNTVRADVIVDTDLTFHMTFGPRASLPQPRPILDKDKRNWGERNGEKGQDGASPLQALYREQLLREEWERSAEDITYEAEPGERRCRINIIRIFRVHISHEDQGIERPSPQGRCDNRGDPMYGFVGCPWEKEEGNRLHWNMSQ